MGRLGVMAVLAVGAGCGTGILQEDPYRGFIRSVRFDKFQTVWVETPLLRVSREEQSMLAGLGGEIRAAAEAVLEGKGFSVAGGLAEADLVVEPAWVTGVEVGPPPSPGTGTTRGETPVVRTTVQLEMQIFDRKDGSVFWRSTGGKPAPAALLPAERVRTMVGRALDTFPRQGVGEVGPVGKAEEE